jgi:hypothetical protein
MKTAFHDSASDQACADSSANSHSAAIEALKTLQPSAAGERVRMRDLAKRLNLNAGYISQIISGRRAPSMRVYKALGLPPPARVVEVPEGFDVAPVCGRCGVVHTTKRCTKGKTTKPRAKAFKIAGRRYYRHEGTDQI